MKLEQSREKLIEANEQEQKIRIVQREIGQIERTMELEADISLSYSNELNVFCDIDLSRDLLKVALNYKRIQLKELETRFNAMWRTKRGGSNDK